MNINAVVAIRNDWDFSNSFCSIDNNWKKDFWRDTERASAYIKNLEVFGNPDNSEMVFICIAQYHEYSFPADDNDIEAIFFVDSEDEALNYLSQKEDIQNDASKNNFEVESWNVLQFISGDIGGSYAQLCGNFVDITDHKSEILKYMCKTDN